VTVRPRLSALGLLICLLLLLMMISTASLNFTTVIRSLNTYVYSTLLEMQSRWTKIQLGKYNLVFSNGTCTGKLILFYFIFCC
jgi:hypothetical protein